MVEATDRTLIASPSSAVAAATAGAAEAGPSYGAAAAPPSPPRAARLDAEEDEDEGDVCRICRNPGEADNPLRYPCACSGSIKYVHQECLLQWLNHSNARHCEVCKHPFSFSPVYAEDAPARLPFQEFLVGMAMKACNVLQFFLRLAFVLSVWLLIIPFITFWIWRLTFVKSLGEAQRLFLSHMSAPLILTDCLHGFLLSASIVFIFLGATSLRDYFRHLREVGGNNAERDEEGQERHGARAVRRLAGPPNRVADGDGNAEDAGGAQGIAGAGQLIRRNAENVAARLEMQAARLEAHVEQMFDGLDDADGAEDVPFDELVGMQGPVFHLVENAITVLASNAIFLSVVIFIPFSLGRIILYYLSWLISSASSPMLEKFIPLTESALSFVNITLRTALTAVKNLSPETHSEGGSGHVLDAVVGSLKPNATGQGLPYGVMNPVSTDILKGTVIDSSRLSDVTTLVVGYMFILSLVAFYLGLLALLRYARGERLSIGRLYGVSTIVETIPSLFRQFLAGTRHLMTMIKVAFLLVIELGRHLQALQSLVCWNCLYAPNKHLRQLLRGVLRSGVLYFLRDPADPNYNPFRDLIDDPVHKHARRVLLSVAVYGSLIIPADVLLFQICIPFAIEHFKPRETIKALLRYWFSVVGWALGLIDFLLPKPEENGGHENGNVVVARRDRLRAERGLHDQLLLQHVAAENHDWRGRAAENTDIGEDSDVDDQADSEYGFVLRIVLLLVLAWMTLLLFNAALVVIPISLGRAIFNAIPRLPITHGIKCNDLFAFSIGFYIIWGVATGVRYSVDYIRARRASVLLSQIWKWCTIVVKSSALLSIWIFVIPVLIGLLFELLVIVPIRVPVDESPVFLLYQDWALGLIFLKIWTRLVMLDQMAPLVDESWRRKFERVREDGFSRLRGLWVFREIVIPIITKLLTLLCVPYVFAKGIFPAFGYPLIVNSAVYRFAWIGCLLFGTLCFCAKRFHVWCTNLHNSIRDDRYLIGRRLHNYGEEAIQKSGELEVIPQNSNLQDGALIRLGREAELGLRLRHANQNPNQQIRHAML
ncbi:putative E3 ubiquitin ligase SUD1 [Ananas comosus]|uniref:RING-type E3 ubiquitin transferase n=1 Tax=Ananas comosus TaxID=4615 RepID=A0A199V123_ANACO|nr:putative E3 ubiquitin ligase SUD1 [Ananas comosus]